MSQAGFNHWTEPFDPNSVWQDYTFELDVGTGVTVTSATVDVVNDTSSAVLAGSPIVSSSVAWGAITGTRQGVTWVPIVPDPNNLPVTPSNCYVRCRYVLSDGRGDDFTMILMVRQK